MTHCFLHVAREEQPRYVTWLERPMRNLGRETPVATLAFPLPAQVVLDKSHYSFPQVWTGDKTEFSMSMENESKCFLTDIEVFLKPAALLSPTSPREDLQLEPVSVGGLRLQEASRDGMLCLVKRPRTGRSSAPYCRHHEQAPPSHPRKHEARTGRWKENLSAQPKKHVSFWHKICILVF